MATVALSETEVASVPDDVLYEVVNGQIVELPFQEVFEAEDVAA